MDGIPPDLPPRLTTSEVCALGRISVRTFARRRREGCYLLEPCDRGAENLWHRDEVLRALDLVQSQPAPMEAAPPKVDPDAIRAARARQIRQRPGPQGRDSARPVRSAGKAAALTLAFDAAAPD